MSEVIHTSSIKQTIIQNIIEHIHDGKKVKEIYDQNKEYLLQITPFDVLQIHAFSHESHFSDQNIKDIAPKLMNLFHNALEQFSWNKETAALYLQMELEEHRLIVEEFQNFKQLLKKTNWFTQKNLIRTHLDKLRGIFLRFLRSQNILYPRLEKHLVSKRPLQIMWSQEDTIKKQYQSLQAKLETASEQEYVGMLGQFFFLAMQTLDRERLLLLPVASFVLTEEELEEMYEEAKEISYHYVTPIKVSKKASKQIEQNTTTFNLSKILDHLTVDVTYVDQDDIVVYFNNPESRIFVRSKSVIGRKVQDCHPKESMHIVQEILDAFKQKKQKQAEFYVHVQGKMLYILYKAIYDATGKYCGTLEISQDVTHIKSLNKEKRLLDWK